MAKAYSGTSIVDLYKSMVSDVLTHGQLVSPRGKANHELRGVVVDTYHHRRLAGAGINYRLATAEAMAWLCGWDDVAWFERFRPGFSQFSDDGLTLHGAYGRRMYSQLPTFIDRLKKDNASRQAVMNIWDGSVDQVASRDLPCNVVVHGLIRDAGLELHVHVRSQDLIWGFPYDHDAWWLVGKSLGVILNFPMARLVQYVDSLHIYKPEAGFYDKAKITKAGYVSQLFSPIVWPTTETLPLTKAGFESVRRAVENGEEVLVHEAWDNLVRYLKS